MNLLVDSRDSAINPDRGWYLNRQLPGVLRGRHGRRLHLAGTVPGCAEIPPADAGRPEEARLLAVRRLRHRRLRAVSRFASHRHGHLRPLGPRLRRGTVQGRAVDVRRGGVSRVADAKRPARNGRLPEPHHRHEPRDGRTPVPLGGARRGRRPPSAASTSARRPTCASMSASARTDPEACTSPSRKRSRRLHSRA